MTIEQVAQKVGVRMQTISNWEQLDAVRPAVLPMSGGGHRRQYEPWQVLRLQAIAALRERGVALPAAIAGADDLVVQWWKQMKPHEARPGGRVDAQQRRRTE